ncbi:MAG: RagB/SusD family nutrient uptake outer membrane protein [Gemmatimonadota bacterium]
MAGGEIWHGGSYDFGQIPLGIFKGEEADWNGSYNSMQQARWVAEAGLRRIAEILEPTQFEKNPDVARAYLLAGFANRILGDMQCRTTIDGGPDLPHTEHFNRADSLFSRAVTVGQTAGKTDIVRAAYGGRASVRLSMGQYSQAAADAAQVPTNFVYNAVFSIANQNDMVYETTYRREFSVWSSMWETVTDDPRVPWIIPVDSNGQVLKGQDGNTRFYQQKKWVSEEDDIPVTKGTEARLIQAEAALRTNDYAAAQGFINQARAQYGMAALTLPTNQAEAWPVLRFERYATNWLEARRLWDMRRWSLEGAPKADPFASGRDLCFPISDRELRANRNVKALTGGCPTCG